MTTAAPPAFFVGANFPWLQYGGDFGANAWSPGGGLAQRTDGAAIVDRLTRLSARGVTVLRWFVLCDGRAGITFEPDGTPAGLDATFLSDFETALSWTGAARLQILPVLLDFHWCHPAKIVNGVQTGGRRRVLADPDRRESLVDTVIAPLLARYGREPLIHAWDIINEPEWITFGAGTWNPFTSLRQSSLRAYVRLVAERAHALATQPVTVGSASTRWLPLVRGLGLDFYQAHWYDRFESTHPLATPVAALGCDQRVILGEFPSAGSMHTPDVLLSRALGAGYAGALFWSVMAEDSATDLSNAEAGLTAWSASAGDDTRLA